MGFAFKSARPPITGTVSGKGPNRTFPWAEESPGLLTCLGVKADLSFPRAIFAVA